MTISEFKLLNVLAQDEVITLHGVFLKNIYQGDSACYFYKLFDFLVKISYDLSNDEYPNIDAFPSVKAFPSDNWSNRAQAPESMN